ncbi:MAG: hypothetical protein V9G04_12735 [Nocardioides sp.]
MARVVRLLASLIAATLGATLLAPGHAQAYEPVQGNVEIVAAYPGVVRIKGWAMSESWPQARLGVWVLRGGGYEYERVGTADLASPGTPWDGHAFDLPVRVGDARYGEIRVAFSEYRPSGGQPFRELYLPDLQREPFGRLDSVSSPGAGLIKIRGWAVDPLELDRPVRIEPRAPMGQVYTGVARPDVVTAYPGYPAGSGFEVTQQVPPGTHQVCVLAWGESGYPSPGDLGCQTVTVNPPGVIRGAMDVATASEGRVRVKGWAFDYDAPAQPLQLLLFVGGNFDTPGVQKIELGPAKLPHPGVNSTFGVPGDHGFDFTVPVDRFGDQPLYLYALNAPGTAGDNTLVGSTTLRIPRDVDPPDTKVTSGPVGTVTSPTVSYSFSATEVGSTFECSWDGEAWTACTSPSTRTLDAGPHVFEVRATDHADNRDETPASRGIIVDPDGTSPVLTVRAKAVKKRSRLRVNIGPDSAAVNYRFRVQRRVHGKWNTVKRSRTRGPKDVRTLDLRRGVYRVKVPTQFGFPARKSRTVRLAR